MLTTLTIQNVVIIEKLVVEFRQGLCALTGETGAGKSILLDSLGLAMGQRAEARLVRKGADKAIVSAAFEVEPSHLVYAILAESDLLIDNSEAIVLRRSLTPDGRSKAYINDQSVSVSLLKKIGESLIEIHGQFDTRGLLNPSTHRQMLDDYAGIGDGVENLWKKFRSDLGALEALKQCQKNAREHEDFLRTALEDLDAFEPKQGEEKELARLRETLMNREQVLDGLNSAYQILNTDNDPVRDALGVLSRISDKLPEQANEVMETLDRATVEVTEALNLISSLSSDLEENEHDLQSIDDRLFGLRAQARKHGVNVDDLADLREKLAQDLNTIEHGDDLLAQAMKTVEKSREQYKSAAIQLSEKRKSVAKTMDDLIAKELPPLKLERAKFVSVISELNDQSWGPHGIDGVEFLVSTNPGADPVSLSKIASGGEMSRFMLALKVVMAEVGSAPTLIFDEVDAGIGGGTADAVGERLSKLAQSKQILVVTHSPQVAARANYQWTVEKSGETEVRTNVVALPDMQSRREEIARMLSGASITEEARAAADKLLEIGKAA